MFSSKNIGKNNAFFFDLQIANYALSCESEKGLSILKLKLLLNNIATLALAPAQQLRIVSYPHVQ